MNYIQTKFIALRTQYYSQFRIVVIVAVIMFLLALFNAIISYLVPGIILNAGYSETQMGLLIATSSGFGILFDFLLGRFLHSTHYKRMILYTIFLCMAFPIVMLYSSTLAFFLVGMAIWALYSNLWSFAFSDFVARESKIAFHATSMALLMTLNDLGYAVGTFVATPIADDYPKDIGLAIMLGILGLTLLLLIYVFIKRKETRPAAEEKKNNETYNLKYLWIVSKKLWPLLLLNLTVIMIEAVIWTVTPVIDHISSQLTGFGGLILSFTFIPSIFAYALTGKITKRFGKKKVAIWSFLLSTVLLTLQGLFSSPLVYITLSTLSNFVSTFYFPASGGAYADYLRESKILDKEILVAEDITANMGYIIGPLLGGFLMHLTGSIVLFTYLGIGTTLIGLVVLAALPKKIDFHDGKILGEVFNNLPEAILPQT